MDPNPAVVTILHRQSTATEPALSKPDSGNFRFALHLGRLEGPFRLTPLGGIKNGHVHDRQMRRFGSFPFICKIGARDSASRIRIFDHLDPIPDDPSGIKFVQNDPMVALLVAVDGRSSPIGAPRGSNSLLIQGKSYFSRRLIRDIVDKDLTNDVRLFLDNFEFSGLTEHRPIDVSSAARVAAIANDTLHATPNFVSKVRQRERAQETADTNLNLIRPHRTQFDSEKIKAFPNPS